MTPDSLPPVTLFSLDQGPQPVTHEYSLDVIVAALRTRFYYTRYMIYRPFIFKALHYPEQMTQEDIECCVICLRSCLRWPICMAPPRNKKRMLPYLFAWTQNFLGILLIFHMTTENSVLKYVRETFFTAGELEESAGLMLDWIQDMRHMDGIAEWSWKIVGPLYAK